MYFSGKNLQKKIEDLERELKELKHENVFLKQIENSLFESLKSHVLGVVISRGDPPEFVFVNQSLVDMTGYSEEDLLNANPEFLAHLIHPEDRDEFFMRYRKRIAGKKVNSIYEMRIVKSDGEVRWVQVFSENLYYRGEPAVFGSFFDITEKKRIEKELTQREEEYRLLFNQTPAGIFYYDIECNITHFNDKFMNLLQSTREKLTGLNMRLLKDKRVLPCIEDALLGKEGHYEGAYDATTGDAHIQITMKTEPLRDSKGNIAGGVGIVQDITSQKETEKALEKSEKRFKELVEWSPIAMAVFDTEGNIVYRNRRAVDDFGYDDTDVPHINQWWEKAYPDDAYREKVKQEWNRAIGEALENGREISPQEWQVTCRDGTVKDVEFRMMPIGNSGFVTMEDLTVRKQTEAELLKARKIESLGVLAGGIAHDFNNILTAVLGNISMARDETISSEQRLRILDLAEKAAWRARSLTQQLLTFSRGGSPVQKAISIRNILTETAEFILSGTPVSSRFEIVPALSSAHVDEGQVGQVIHNILLNARQAIDGSGIITIRAENFFNSGCMKDITPGDYIRISIQDSGRGISKEDINNIFDPFFTTKEDGNGLGLSVSYSIVKKHGGTIEVSSDRGKGTCFDVYLPASKEKPGEISEPYNVEVADTGSILLMDDDPMVLDISKKFLEHIGFSVDTAEHGEAALAMYEESFNAGKPFDLVILDLTIRGGMGGEETMRGLKKIDPHVIGIVASGYSNDPVMARFSEYGFSGVIIKPFSIDDVKDTVFSLLGKRGHGS